MTDETIPQTEETTPVETREQRAVALLRALVAAIREALTAFGRQIRGFDMDDAVLTGVETRTSSPVRVPRGEYTWLARALDLGATGVMIPMVESRAHAESIVQACRYPPVGRRGAAFGFAQCDYLGGDVDEKIRIAHERTLVIAQIETEHGLANVEEIAAVDGIDVLWVGHFDLSNFMGIPGRFNDPRFDAAMRKVVEACRRHGKVPGFMATDPAWVRRAQQMGYTMIAAGTDNGLLQQAFAGLVRQIDGQPE